MPFSVDFVSILSTKPTLTLVSLLKISLAIFFAYLFRTAITQWTLCWACALYAGERTNWNLIFQLTKFMTDYRELR